MKVKFLADADFSQLVIRGLQRREPSIDFQFAEEAELAGRPDIEVLEIAANSQRILVTHDRRTMPGAFGDFVLRRQSPGVLILPQHLPVAIAIEELLLVWSASDAEDWINRISAVPL
jgi:predicted nuclease of predicted toxin-antitoxin system